MNRSWQHLLLLVGSLAVYLLVVSVPRIIQTAGRLQLPTVISRSQTAQVGGGGATYYVSTSGSDSNPGTIDEPWQNFDRAFDLNQAPHFSGGDTLYLRTGVYHSVKSDVVVDNQISGLPGHQTIISSYPGENAAVYLSTRVDAGWKKYVGGTGANIWYVDWSHIGRDVPQIVAIDGNSPTLLQEVNSAKNANPGYQVGIQLLKSFRTNQDDMIAGDFYYESDSASPNYGYLYITLPDGSGPNGQPIEIGLNQNLFYWQHNVTISNLSIRYSNYGPTVNGDSNIVDTVDSSYNGMTGLTGLCSNCIVRNSIMSHNGDNGATLSGPHTLYENNTFEANNYRLYTSNWACGGMKIILNNQDMIVRGNTFKDTIACPGLWFDNVPSGFTIENNKFINNGLMIEISSGSADQPIIVRNNIFEKNGIYVSASNYVYMFNNTLDTGGILLHGLGGDRTSVSNNKIINNIFYNQWLPIYIAYNPPAPYKSENNISDYNLFFGPSMVFGNVGGDLDWNNGISYTAWKSRGFDAHSIVGDPLFANAGAGDYSLQSGSPAIGTGLVNNYATNDIRRTSRTEVNDIGAYQVSVAATPTPPPAQSQTTSETPNPVSTAIYTSSGGGSSAQNRVSNLISMGQYSLAQQVAEQYGILISQNLAPAATQVPTPTSVIDLPQSHFVYQSLDQTSYLGMHSFSQASLPVQQITRNLILNDQGEDVRQLQRVLNNLGYAVVSSGAGSSGNETTVFGSSTAKSLMDYQTDKKGYGIIPSGKLDNATLVLINADIKRVLIDQTPGLVLNTGTPLTPTVLNTPWYQRLISSVAVYIDKVVP